MGIFRMIGLGVLGILFVLALTAANFAVAADRTVLNDEFVTDTADEANVYAVIAEELRAEALAGAPDDGGLNELPIDGVDFETLVNNAITEDWVRSQFEPAIEDTFGFLQGESESLVITIETDSLQEDATAALREEGTLDFTALEDERAAQLDRMTESPEQFEAERDEFRSEQKDDLQAATDEDLSEEELADLLDEQLADNRELIQSEFTAALPPSLSDAEEPVATLAGAWVDAMLGEVEYDTFVSTVEAATDEVLTSAVDTFFAEAAPFPESIEFTDDELSAEERDTLETARDAVSLFSLAPFALGGAVVLFAGGIFVLASHSGAAIGIGTLSALVGGSTAGVTVLLRQEVPVLVDGIPEALRGSMLTIIDAILDVVFVQSAVLATIGVGAIALGIGIRRDLLLADDAPVTTTDDGPTPQGESADESSKPPESPPEHAASEEAPPAPPEPDEPTDETEPTTAAKSEAAQAGESDPEDN